MTKTQKFFNNSLSSLFVVGLRFLLSLFIARLLVQSMGLEGFGILTALGASGLFVHLINGGLIQAVSRHMAFEVARRDQQKLNEMVSSTVLVSTILSLVIIFAGFGLKEHILAHLSYPESLARDVVVVYWTVVWTLVGTTLLALPEALFTAYQDISIAAGFQMALNLSNLFLLLVINQFSESPIIHYSVGMMFLMIVVSILRGIVSWRRYREVRCSPRLIKLESLSRIWQYSRWSLCNLTVTQLRNNASVIVVNLSHGVIANAGMALAVRSNSVVSLMPQALQRVFEPALTHAYAEGNRERFIHLVSATCRFMFIATALIFIPIALETDRLLYYWIGEVPTDTSLLIQLVCLATLLSMLASGYAFGMSASNRIGEYVRFSCGVQVACYLLGYVLLYFYNFPVYWLPICGILPMLIILPISPILFGGSLGFRAVKWLRKVLLPSMACLLLAFIPALYLKGVMPIGFIRLCCISCLACGLFLLAAWYLLVDAEEKSNISKQLRILLKLRPYPQNAS